MRWNVVKILFCFSAALLSACSFNPFRRDNHLTGSPAATIGGAAIGIGSAALLGAPKPIILLAGIGGGAIGYYFTSLRYDAGGIVQAGGQVYSNGDYVGINVPADSLFEPNTTELQPNATTILDSIVDVVDRYPDHNIFISGNTDGFDRPRRENKLAEQRAKLVADYLTENGVTNFQNQSIRSRKLTYVGYGNYFPIANDRTNDSIRMNNRIQITLYPTNVQLGLTKRQQIYKNMGASAEEEEN